MMASDQGDVMAQMAKSGYGEQADRAAPDNDHPLAGDDGGTPSTVPGHAGRLDEAGVLEG
jgi:hypothetical protein